MRSEPEPPICPGPRNATPPPPENMGSMQHQCMFNFSGAAAAEMWLVKPGGFGSSSSESESGGSSDIRLGDRCEPGAHQKRFVLGLEGYRGAEEDVRLKCWWTVGSAGGVVAGVATEMDV
jgi:hypothetical protein